MIGVAWQSKITAVTDRNSLLYNIVAGEEVIEGPLDPSAYANTDAPGVGGARLAALEGNVGIELITFDDPEVNFASTLGGNAVIAPLSPLEPEPGSQEPVRSTSPQKPIIYTIQSGDTIASVSARYNISTNTVLWANGLSKNTTIRVGDHLTILPTTGILHTVKSGDTVLKLASVYQANATDIIKYNSLDDEAKLGIGQKIIVPDGYISPRSAPQVVSGLADSGIAPPPSTATGTGLIWPTTSKHISQYFRWGHTGIDIDNRSRPPIYAAAAGTVEFVGRLGGYGNLVIINHGGGLSTYYAHNEINYVKKGESVAKGTAIAKVGSTGRSTGPHLHFEVRKHGRPVNPLSMY
jgi:murein DD-endopeptidase MepM/ murein hydrolase activator NlpD